MTLADITFQKQAQLSMAFALNRMSSAGVNSTRYQVLEDEYVFARENLSKLMTGREVSASTRLLISKSNRGRKMPREVVERTKVTNLRLCEFCNTSMNQINFKKYHGIHCNLNPDYIKLEQKQCEFCRNWFDLPNYSKWHGPRCKSSPLANFDRHLKTKICHYCQGTFAVTNFAKYHGENCKLGPTPYIITDEFRSLISSKNKGNKCSEESKAKLSASKTGVKLQCFSCEFCGRNDIVGQVILKDDME
jgi:hypothetical protein